MKRTTKYLAIMALMIGVLCAFTILSGDADARTCTWDSGGADDKTSTAANWDLDLAPVPGDSIIISSTADAIVWDLSNNSFLSFTTATGFSGSVTQTTDLYVGQFVVGAGTWTGSETCTVYMVGDTAQISINAGTFTAAKTRFDVTGNNVAMSSAISPTYILIHTLTVHDGAVVTKTGTTINVLRLVNNGTVTIGTGYIYSIMDNAGSITPQFTNNGIINGAGTGLMIRLTYTSQSIAIGDVRVPVTVIDTYTSVNCVLTLTSDATISSTLAVSGSSSKTMTINLNGRNLTASSITLNARGVLKNTGADSTATCAIFDSSNAAAVLTGTNIDLIMTGISSLKIKDSEFVESVTCQLPSLNITGTANITDELLFIGLTDSHPYGWYENGTRASSVTTTSSGTYSLGSGVFAWDNATLKITPVITPNEEWTHDDGSGNTYTWVDFHWWLDFVSDDDSVAWSVADCSWLTMYDEGMIAGVPSVAGNYSYNITAVASNGEVGTYSGYVIVHEFLPDPDWPDNPGDVIEISVPILYRMGDVDVTMWSEYDPYYIEVTNDTLMYATVAGEYPMTFWASGAVAFNITTFSPYGDIFLEGDLTSAGEDLYLRIGGFQPGAVVRHVIDGSLSSTTVDGAGYLHLNITNIVDVHIELSIVITPPMFTTSPDIVANEMVWYSYQVGVFPSGTTVTAVELPYWMYWDDETLSMVGLPRDPGTFECRLMATNGFGVSWQNWTIYIYTQEIGFSSNPLLVVDKFDLYQYDVAYYPPNADCKVLVKPIWLHFNEYTDTFDGQAFQVGSFNVVIRITIGHAVAYQNFTITVNDVVGPPSWLDTPSTMDMGHAMFYILLGVGVAFMLIVFYMRRKL